MKKCSEAKRAQVIASTAATAIMAVAATTAIPASSVCADEIPMALTVQIDADSESDNDRSGYIRVIKGIDGRNYPFDIEKGSRVPLNFIGEDGCHYYIDDKCMAKANNGYGEIKVFDSDVWDKGHALTEISGVPLEKIIILKNKAFPGNAGYISSIRKTYNDGGFYDYSMKIHGKGAGASFKHCSQLNFSDGTDGRDNLYIFDTLLKKYTVNHAGCNPEFNTVSWGMFDL